MEQTPPPGVRDGGIRAKPPATKRSRPSEKSAMEVEGEEPLPNPLAGQKGGALSFKDVCANGKENHGLSWDEVLGETIEEEVNLTHELAGRNLCPTLAISKEDYRKACDPWRKTLIIKKRKGGGPRKKAQISTQSRPPATWSHFDALSWEGQDTPIQATPAGQLQRHSLTRGKQAANPTPQGKNPKPTLGKNQKSDLNSSKPRGPAHALRDVTNFASSSKSPNPSPISNLGPTTSKTQQFTLGHFFKDQLPAIKQKKKNPKESVSVQGNSSFSLDAEIPNPFLPPPADLPPPTLIPYAPLDPSHTPPNELPLETFNSSSSVDLVVRGLKSGSDTATENCEPFPSEMQVEREPASTPSLGGECDLTDEQLINNGVSAMEGLCPLLE
ncbi:hypothetical protein COLO4_29738 [Corchorus olitorius]|uniref:Uncharacterized protein n=1 Tax=Corchorus olitorius TaxID=93759 RepID=A0A1R3HDI8_9ROSI|nr:hypothetical protein COLO4_29738 [Corchorus olitorius]